MESEFENLTGQLDSIKRESLRPAIKGDSTGPLLQTSAVRQALQPLANESSLAARLQALKKEAKPATLTPQEEQVEFVAAGQMEGATLAEQAKELFDVPEFAELCNKGLNAQLQRTKDGATDKSRIAELAGLVKTLRRALKEMTARSTAFVNAGLRFEKEAFAQVEGVKLAAESSSKQLEAEMAALKRDAAQAAAAHKQAAASWHIELDLQKAEACHAKRELERLGAERDRAREEARKAEEMRAALEGNVKGLKKEAGQQLRDLQVDHGEAMRTLAEVHEAHAKREAELQEEIKALKKRSETAAAHSRAIEAEAAAVKQELLQRNQEVSAAVKSRDELQKDCQKMAAGLEEHERLHREVAAQSSSSANEAAMLHQRCTLLAQQLASKEALLQSAVSAAESEAEAHARESTELQQRLLAAEGEFRAIVARETELGAEKQQMTALLGAARQQAAKLDAELSEAKAQIRDLTCQLATLEANEVAAAEAAKTAKSKIQRLEADLRDTQTRLEEEVESRKTLATEAAAKAARLARLEGEFEAMQDAIGTGSVDQAEMLGRLISRVASLEAAVAEAHCARRDLHNQLVNLRGNIRVFCRIKPHPKPSLVCLPDGVSVRAELDGKEQAFVFDKVFGAGASQKAVFDEVAEIVQCALDGYQVCLFSYGQTGAGKTHTMQGGRSLEAQGIIPRAVAKILEEAAALREKGWEYNLEATFVEVYNESLRDLLAEGKGRDVGKLPDANVIKHHPAGGPSTVVGAVRAKISTPEEAAALVKRAAASRSVEATAMNAVSSRSHSIFMLYISGHHGGSSTHLLGGLNLVDLAGSERLDRSLAEGQRQKEACSINKSLSALGDVFSALSARNPHVPYRNSKLTHLLQPCLGGDGKTLMFVNVSPEAESLQETMCSLRFAAKVNACQTAARGGAKRHVSVAGDARASLQGPKRQSVTAPATKRKALTATASRVTKPRV